MLELVGRTWKKAVTHFVSISLALCYFKWELNNSIRFWHSDSCNICHQVGIVLLHFQQYRFLKVPIAYTVHDNEVQYIPVHNYFTYYSARFKLKYCSIQAETKSQHWARWRWGIRPEYRVSLAAVQCYVWTDEPVTWSNYHLPSYFSPPIQVSNKTANHSAVQSREPVRKSGGCMWRALRLLLLLAVLAAAVYYVYCRVINDEDNPFGIQWSDLIDFLRLKTKTLFCTPKIYATRGLLMHYLKSPINALFPLIC